MYLVLPGLTLTTLWSAAQSATLIPRYLEVSFPFFFIYTAGFLYSLPGNPRILPCNDFVRVKPLSKHRVVCVSLKSLPVGRTCCFKVIPTGMRILRAKIVKIVLLQQRHQLKFIIRRICQLKKIKKSCNACIGMTAIQTVLYTHLGTLLLDTTSVNSNSKKKKFWPFPSKHWTLA